MTDSATTVTALRTNHPRGLLGVPSGRLVVSWRVRSSDPAAQQLAFELQSCADEDFEVITSTGVVSGASAIARDAPGGPLASREVRFLRVRIATHRGWTRWSPVCRVEAGLTQVSDWHARAVGIPCTPGGPSPLLRREFVVRDVPLRARLHVTSLGVNDIAINGQRVSGDHLAPGWTPYHQRLLVSTHDVTDLLVRGLNAIGAALGDGWFRGRLGWLGVDQHYGGELALIAQLEITYPDGSTDRVVTDEAWRGSIGHIRASGIYDGVDIDWRMEPTGWGSAGFDDASWQPVRLVPWQMEVLAAAGAPPIREIRTFTMRVERAGEGLILDAGQNLAGWVRLTVRGHAGDRVVVRHAEMLDTSGDLLTMPLRSARATDTYLLRDEGVTTLEPVFTFHGFRFAEVTGDAEVLSAVAVAISSDNEPRGDFETAEPALVRLHDNVVWSQLSNFLSVPTDCPQRDERLGWTGDAQAFAATASTLFDTAAFWQSWLVDLALEQEADGGVTAVVPNVLDPEAIVVEGSPVGVVGRAGWGDAATIVPWAVYESYGDDSVLRRQLPSMRAWISHLLARRGPDGLLPTEFQFGDWLDPDAALPWKAKVSGDFVANAFFAHSARILARAEALVGDRARAAQASALADEVAGLAWARHGPAALASQTGCALALQLAVAPASERARVAAALAADVDRRSGAIATGFLGTPLVLEALSNTGHVEQAYRMLLRRDAPSWLYQVEVGATTVWERWDALRPDGSVNPADPTDPASPNLLSLNHYAYGAVVDWMYRNVAGLAPVADAPGYQSVLIAPRPTVGVPWARAAIDTSLGRLAIDWTLRPHGDVRIDLEIPFGTTAVLALPITERSIITVDGEMSHDGARLTHGDHQIVVTAPSVASV
ncbi:alpha-L-rhamnosidase [Cellulomonas sp. KRMCY2]|uniref:alpha-L-rhamnosidase n=1 Tax=Cellulomonas sp. KRMCY2 TaxID=1304865 RepID=UPI0012DD31D5|nr:alpha-L-rhamnosidase [Cellulomonas sp. KRMCY2]